MVYLLHFDRPFRHMRHYVGSVASLAELEQLLEHPTIRARSPILAAATLAGVQFSVGRVWRGGALRADLVRDQQNHARYCDICTCARSGVAVP